MTTSDQVASLMETLIELRDELNPDIPDALLREIVVAHAEDADSPALHRKVQRALEQSLEQEREGGERAPD